jgi:hypothetical protein
MQYTRGLLARTLAVIATLCMTAVSEAQPQRASEIPTLLVRIHAEQWTTRRDAFERLKHERSTLARRDVRKALFELLDRENQLSVATLRESAETLGVSDKFGEDYSEYVGELGEAVTSFADWTDQEQVCVLVRKAYNPNSVFVDKIASHGKVALPCLIDLLGSDLGTLRAKAGPVIVHVLATARDLDPKERETARQMVLKALHDPDLVVRSFVVFGLADYGGVDMIPALQEVADTDPAPEVQGHSVRKRAIEAIAAINKRAARRQK